MKKIKSISIIILAIGAMLLSSCSSTPESLKTIPKESSVVSAIDVYSIIQKGKLTELSDMKFFKTFKKELRNENKKVSRIMDDIMEDPTLTGIDFTNDVFIYYVDQADDERYVCISAEISDELKFSEFIEDLLDKSDVEYDIEEEKEYKYTIVNEKLAIGWDTKKMVFLTASNYSSRENIEMAVEELISLKEKDQITANEEFNNFYKDKKDVSVWLSTNIFENDYSYRRLEESIDIDLSDNYISTYLNFDDNEITLLTRLSPNKEIQELLTKNNITDNTFNSELLNFFPKDAYSASSISVNPMAIYNILKQEEEFERFEEDFEKETEFNLKDIFKNIGGNIVYSTFDFEEVEYTYMDWGYGFNEEYATMLETKYPISEAGYLSEINKEELNAGKTINCDRYGGKYCISIQNILDEGGNIETAIENNSEITWYDGGWDYGPYVETERKEYLPMMGIAFDINSNKIIKQLIESFPEDKLNKRSGYYEFKFDNKYPAYFAFNTKTCFVTNDLKSIKSFKSGGLKTDNLNNSPYVSDIMNSSYFSYSNINIDSYPKKFKKQITENGGTIQNKLIKIWDEFAESIVIKQGEGYSIEIIFKTKENDTNTLDLLISTIDDNYKYFM